MLSDSIELKRLFVQLWFKQGDEKIQQMPKRRRKHRCQKERPKKRKLRTEANKMRETVWKHEEALAIRFSLEAKSKTRSTRETLLWTKHRTHFKGKPLMFIGYELNVCEQEGMGMGLKANMFIPKGTVITQYEGVVVERAVADKIRQEANGKYMASFFKTTPAREFVINGISLDCCPLPDPTPGKSRGTPLSRREIKGFGGASFCNHSDTPNAKFVTLPDEDGFGVLVAAIRDIEPKSFITVSYGSNFIISKWTNL
jgi:hypothetical protein